MLHQVASLVVMEDFSVSTWCLQLDKQAKADLGQMTDILLLDHMMIYGFLLSIILPLF